MEEKLVFLKREEIRTMAKDLARLQEEEAIKEKDKISKLKFEEKLKNETSQREEIIKTMIPGEETEVLESKEDMANEEISSRIKKSSPQKKILVRILIVLSFFIFLSLIGFSYWYFAIRKKQNSQPSPEPSESPTPSASISPSISPSLSPQPTESINPAIPPIPVISVKEIKIINLSQESDFQKELSQAIKEIIVVGDNPEFFEILPKKNDQFLGIKDLFEGLELKLPENFLSSVSDKIEDFDFFVYTKKNLNQGFGFIVKEKEPLSILLSSWEPTMPLDLSNLFTTMDKQATMTNTVFKQAKYADATFRYLSFKESGLGVCWSVYKNYLIITSSGEIMNKTIDLVQTKTNN